MGPKLKVGMTLDLRTADKMTIKYNKKEDKYGNPTNHIKSFSLITPCSKTLSTCFAWANMDSIVNSVVVY